MSRAPSAARLAAAPALGSAAALAAMLFASRLPPGPELFLPRRAGWTLYALAFELFGRPAGRAVFSALVTAALLLSAGLFAARAWSAVKGRREGALAMIGRAAGLAVVIALLRWSGLIWLELSQKVWFPFGALNPWEPAANLAAGALLLEAAMAAVLGLLGPQPKELRRALIGWAAANIAAAGLASGVYRAWRGPPGAWLEQGPERTVLYLTLTEDQGRPGQAAYRLAAPLDDKTLGEVELRAASRGADRLEALRLLYEQQSKRMDPGGLRRALLLGVDQGDGLARSLLLDHLAASPPGEAPLAALGALADERRFRVGPLGAARLARVFAYLGDAPAASLWAERAARGPRGLPRGLLDLAPGGALNPGRVQGKVAGLLPGRIGLYRRPDAAAPYLLDAGALVAATAPDAAGGYSFSGLAAGRYYLAFAFIENAPRGELRARGSRGDIILDERRVKRELPPLTFKTASP